MKSLVTIPPGIVLSLFSLDTEEAYRNGVFVYDVRLKRTDTGWLAILKAQREGDFLVAFVGGAGFHQALFNVGTAVDDSGLAWHVDKWPPKSGYVQLDLLA